MNKKHVKGIITEIGGITSHTAILAKSFGMPAILSLTNARKRLKHGETIIIDSIKGELIQDADEALIEKYQAKQATYLGQKAAEKAYLDKKAVTKDHDDIDVMINIGSDTDEALDYIDYVDGVGLFRSEFLYMQSTNFPSEEKQFLAYKTTLERSKGKKVTLRTLDIGGDKTLSYYDLPKEDNPFLGKRALRLCFDEMAMFKTQLRAALRASVFGNLYLMFPMVSSIEDIVEVKQVLKEIEIELTNENIAFGKYKVGIMIEIPAIILMSDEVCKLVDFASIGTNDLTQYLTATDRMNESVSKYYQNYSPSLFRMIKIAADAFIANGKELSVCGELGGDLIGASVLIGLGIKKLSMNKNAVAAVKKLVINHSMIEFNTLANDVIKLDTEDKVIDRVNKLILEVENNV